MRTLLPSPMDANLALQGRISPSEDSAAPA
jgi:hypothetical protein